MLIFVRWFDMTDMISHPKIQAPVHNIFDVTAFSNLHDISMVTMETNGLTNFLHRSFTFSPNLVPFCPFTTEKKPVKLMSYTLGHIELDTG